MLRNTSIHGSRPPVSDEVMVVSGCSTEMRWNWWKKSGPLAILGTFHAQCHAAVDSWWTDRGGFKHLQRLIPAKLDMISNPIDAELR